jgi:hypothetical protein
MIRPALNKRRKSLRPKRKKGEQLRGHPGRKSVEVEAKWSSM